MKTQWHSINLDQEERFTAFRERKTQIEKDVSRTDRTHPFFAGDDNKNIDLLQDILMTYVMYNFDLGYVQVSKLILFVYKIYPINFCLHIFLCCLFKLFIFVVLILGNVRPFSSHSLRNAK